MGVFQKTQSGQKDIKTIDFRQKARICKTGIFAFQFLNIRICLIRHQQVSSWRCKELRLNMVRQGARENCHIPGRSYRLVQNCFQQTRKNFKKIIPCVSILVPTPRQGRSIDLWDDLQTQPQQTPDVGSEIPVPVSQHQHGTLLCPTD